MVVLATAPPGPAHVNLPQGSIASGPNGRSAALWDYIFYRNERGAYFREGNRGNSWSDVEVLDANRFVATPSLISLENGNWLAVWYSARGSRWLIRAAEKRAGGHFGKPQTIATGARGSYGRGILLTQLATGEAQVIYAEGFLRSTTSVGTIYSRVRTGRDTWSKPAKLPLDFYPAIIRQADLAVSARGTSLALVDEADRAALRVYEFTKAGGWSKSQQMPFGFDELGSTSLLRSASGGLTLVWEVRLNERVSVWYVDGDAEGNWGVPSQVPGTRDTDENKVDGDHLVVGRADGALALLWTDEAGQTTWIDRYADGTWHASSAGPLTPGARLTPMRGDRWRATWALGRAHVVTRTLVRESPNEFGPVNRVGRGIPAHVVEGPQSTYSIFTWSPTRLAVTQFTN